MKVKKSILNGSDVMNVDDVREERYLRIENTPFAAVMNENDNWILLMGDAKVNHLEFECYQDAEDYVFQYDWDMLMTFVLKILEVCDIDINKFKGE